MMTMKLTTRELTPELWPQVETLFGSKGACGGCWCQAWRIGPGEKWDEIKGDPAKARLRAGVADGSVHAVLAFKGERPVGWCTFGPRLSFPKLARARTLKCDDAERVWSITCFFIVRDHRGRGVATALLAHALKAMKRRQVAIVEGYPSKPDAAGNYVPTFAWTGTQSLFRKAGFEVVGNPDGGRQRVRLMLDRADP